MPRRVPDLGKIAGAIDWKPSILLPQILTDVIQFYRREA